MNKVILSALALASASVFAGDYESVSDDSVAGYWRFNNTQNYKEDSSSSKSDITGWSNGAAGKADAGRGGGYLNLPKSGSNYGKATATLKGSRDWRGPAPNNTVNRYSAAVCDG